MPATQLFAVTSAEEFWQEIARPWFRSQALAALHETRPIIVLTPNRAEGFYLRSRLVEESTPLLGARFWTPSDVRKFLLAHYNPGVNAATQAELRLLARICAERLVAEPSEDEASLRSVVREPAAFLRAYDLLLGAGWDPAREGVTYGRKLAQAWQRTLKQGNIDTQAGIHRRLSTAASAAKQPVLGRLLISGFSAAHWPLWDLLKATVLSADETVLVLTQPRLFGEGIDQLWHSSWEAFAKTEAIIPDSATETQPRPFARLAASYETGSRDPLKGQDLTFCVAPDLATQTHAVVLRALDYLRRDDCTRLGLAFPEANALALQVAAELRRLGVALDDGPGFLKPGIFERRSWLAWLDLQDEPGVPTLIAWLRACEAEGLPFAAHTTLSADTLAWMLDGALGETLVDDLDFLGRHLAEEPGKNHASETAEFLRTRIALPPEATFALFLDITRQAVALRGWEAYRAGMADAPAWLRKNPEAISRRAFLAWLRDSTVSQSRARGADSNHFYGKVHLLVYGQLGVQTWSHLILTGLNEGVWPRVFEAGAFGSRHELEALNRQARALNRRVRETGTQGEGHEIVRDGFGHCLLPLERQDLALRDLCDALEATSASVCLAATTTEAGRALLPSDFFNHAFHAATGRALDEETFSRLADATQTWCRRHDYLVDAPQNTPEASLAALRSAHTARRDRTQPFGPYEFAYDTPPEQAIQLWSKAWETAWHHPSSAWLEGVIGAALWPEGEFSWPRAIGTWVHRWLAQALKNSRVRGTDALVSLVREAATHEAQRVRDRATSANVPLYPWWAQIWSQAQAISIGLAENLQPVLPGRAFEFEFRIPPRVHAALPGSELADFELKGRIDLMLFPVGVSNVDPTTAAFAATPCWIVDFKTGAAKTLTARDVAAGRGLQILLYALAARSIGAGAVSLSLLTRNAPLQEQVELDAALQNAPLFRSLEILHRDGIFGMRPDAESDYGFSPVYPMATRFIPRHVLEAKWALVHGGAANAEEIDA